MTDITLPSPSTGSLRAGQSMRRRRMIGLAACLVAVALACFASLVFGSRIVAWPDIVAGITNPEPGNVAQLAVNQRIPRTITGLVVGASLGLAGAVMQGVTRNPLADPGILGVNAGAALAIVIGIAYAGLSAVVGYVWFAFVGAALAAVTVYVIASLGREGATPLKLALAGAATSAALTSMSTMVLLPRVDALEDFRFWQLGSLGRTNVGTLVTVAPFFIVGALLAIGSARGLDALALGDDAAVGLGRRTGAVRATAALAAVILCGTATAVAGPIAFVGLTMAHLARAFTGPTYRWIMPFAAMFGAALLVTADVLGRVLARPYVLEVGLMTAVIGAPMFIMIIRRQKIREL